MKWVLIIVMYGFWNGRVERVEIAKFDTIEQCEAASAKLLRSTNKSYLCAKEQPHE